MTQPGRANSRNSATVQTPRYQRGSRTSTPSATAVAQPPSAVASIQPFRFSIQAMYQAAACRAKTRAA